MTRDRIWLWPNLLSLDAPVVAVLWQILFARCFHASMGPAASVLLVIAVWLIYAGDRMQDAWRGAVTSPRHEFYREHWEIVAPIWVVLSAAGVWIAKTQLTAELWSRGAWVAIGALAYLAAVHGLPRAWRARGLKEAAVGIVFAIGVSLTAWPMIRTWADILAIALFCGLCWANCVAIEDWEAGRDARAGMWWAAACVAVGAVLLREHRPVLGCAESASALGLVLLDRWRVSMSREAARVLADVVLLTPLLLLHVAGTTA